MKKVFGILATASLLVACGGNQPVKEPGLKDVLGDKFLVGTALNVNQSSGRDTASLEIVKKHFNAIVAENCMKSEEIHPEKDKFNFEDADKLVQFGIDNDITVTGHCLIWHSQCARWIWQDENGKDVSPEVLKQNMKEHITAIVQRYKGKILGWDVVNEAIMEDGSYRKSMFYRILGEEFIPLAFQYAHEADPDIELYYNDYNMHEPGKRATVVKLIKDLKARGLRIDAVGMQGHVGMDHNMAEFENSIKAYAEAGVKVMITELDMSALPNRRWSANISDIEEYRESMNPYKEALPDSVSQKWNAKMMDFMNLFIKYQDVITRVTAWGVTDRDSWKNDFPVRGRTDYPLFFDRQGEPKQFVKDLISGAK